MIALDDGTKPEPKSRSTIRAGQRLLLLYAGGGGYGDPKQRPRGTVQDDIRDGYISAEAAQRDYGFE